MHQPLDTFLFVYLKKLVLNESFNFYIAAVLSSDFLKIFCTYIILGIFK